MSSNWDNMVGPKPADYSIWEQAWSANFDVFSGARIQWYLSFRILSKSIKVVEMKQVGISQSTQECKQNIIPCTSCQLKIWVAKDGLSFQLVFHSAYSQGTFPTLVSQFYTQCLCVCALWIVMENGWDHERGNLTLFLSISWNWKVFNKGWFNWNLTWSPWQVA